MFNVNPKRFPSENTILSKAISVPETSVIKAILQEQTFKFNQLLKILRHTLHQTRYNTEVQINQFNTMQFVLIKGTLYRMYIHL